MSNKPFMADTWFNLQGPSVSKVNSRTSTGSLNKDTTEVINGQGIAPKSPSQLAFSPSSFLIPDWKSECYGSSKAAITTKNIYHKLSQDAYKQLKSLHTPNRSLILSLYNEFLSYADFKNVICDNLDSHTTFWEHLLSGRSEYRTILEDFAEVYCFRVAALYLYKIRFIVLLANELEITLNENTLLNPSFFLSKIFKNGSSSELLCESLQANQYTWYRPSSVYRNHLIRSLHNFLIISNSEMVQICSQSTEEKEHSHSLSHKSFGLFLNNLLIELPQWLNNSCPANFGTGHSDVINAKIAGDNLGSLALSYWAGQENTQESNPSMLICPSFRGFDFENGHYVKICQELQLLAFLVQVAPLTKQDPTSFLAQTIRKRQYYSATKQASLFSQHEVKNDLLFNRIVLNLGDLPKTNSHHYLLNQIYNQKDSLTEDGLLYVLTDQKLFVPSHSKKVEQLLTIFKLETFFNLEPLFGKGEIPDNIYVFSKKKTDYENPFDRYLNSKNYYQLKVQKKSCLTFRWSGELAIFGQFGGLVSELNNFFDRKDRSALIYQKEIDPDLSFEFHQNAIVEGKLLHSNSSDPDQITHPNFFKNLTKSCIPLEYCFKIESLSGNNKHVKNHDEVTSQLLGIKFNVEDNYPLVLIVNQSDPGDIQIELISIDSYKAKVEQYGHAYYHYFGLTPKVPDLNINLFRDFFDSNLGTQIIQLSLCDGPTKLKAKLKALLVPKFFLMQVPLPRKLDNELQMLKLTSAQLMEINPQRLKDLFEKVEQTIPNIGPDFPFYTMGLLSYFKLNIGNCLKKFETGNHSTYNNPIMIDSLLKLESFPIFPNHKDIYIDFQNKTPEEIGLPLTDISLNSNDDNHYLELKSEDKSIVRIYSEKQMLEFMEFILISVVKTPIGEILQNLQVPRTRDLGNIVDGFNQTDSNFKTFYRKCESMIGQLINQQVASN